MLGLEIYHMKDIGEKTLAMRKETVEQPVSTGPHSITPEEGCFIVLKFVELPDQD